MDADIFANSYRECHGIRNCCHVFLSCYVKVAGPSLGEVVWNDFLATDAFNEAGEISLPDKIHICCSITISVQPHSFLMEAPVSIMRCVVYVHIFKQMSNYATSQTRGFFFKRLASVEFLWGFLFQWAQPLIPWQIPTWWCSDLTIHQHFWVFWEVLVLSREPEGYLWVICMSYAIMLQSHFSWLPTCIGTW